MKIVLVGHSDIVGGAARAAYRLHRSFFVEDMDSQMWVRVKTSDDYSVKGAGTRLGDVFSGLRSRIGAQVRFLQKPIDSTPRSFNFLPSNWSKKLNQSDFDVVNLHWVGNDTLSISDIARIKKPLVWTLHDMWAFCGAEHVGAIDSSARWINGYERHNRPTGDRWLDLDRIVWRSKLKAWVRPIHIVTPSSWLANCARESLLFRNWPISVIPNVVDTEVFRPVNRILARDLLGLPRDRKIILFGAVGGTADPNKGYDLLSKALDAISQNDHKNQLMCLIFGQSKPRNALSSAIETRWVGKLHDDISLVLLYSAADVMVVPSRVEALGQTATEAQACGCPVVGFDCTGLADAVANRVTGYLARPYDPIDLADGIKWVIEGAGSKLALHENARSRAVKCWSRRVVVDRYENVYREAFELQKIR